MNTTTANFLDVTFNLSSGKYQPYRKPNNDPLYIDKKSNHPPTIIKRLPKLIEQRISELSHGQEEFNSVKADYEEALLKSGHNKTLNYEKPAPKQRSRKRKVTYYNPPYNAAVTNNVGKEFLKLIDKHFPTNSKYHQIFNRNTIKVSYSCLPNMKKVISGHNSSLLKTKPEENESKICNCRMECPLPSNNECRSACVIYKATVTTANATKSYIGSTESDIKLRIANHNQSFRNKKLRYATRLSAYIHDLQDNDNPFDIKWDILSKSNPYQCGSRICHLCIDEKLKILRSNPPETLNTRTEIANKCRHRLKFKLRNVSLIYILIIPIWFLNPFADHSMKEVLNCG